AAQERGLQVLVVLSVGELHQLGLRDLDLAVGRPPRALLDGECPVIDLELPARAVDVELPYAGGVDEAWVVAAGRERAEEIARRCDVHAPGGLHPACPSSRDARAPAD